MSQNARLNLLKIFFTLFTIAVLSRLFYWQVVSHARLSAEADSQHFSFYEIPARRGEIKTSDGYALVGNKPSFTLYASLRDLELPSEEIVAKLAPLFLQLSLEEKISADLPAPEVQTLEAEVKESLKVELSKGKDSWVVLRRRLPKEVMATIQNLKIKGLGFQSQETRFYPESSMAAQLVGFVGSDTTGHDQGYFGLEGFYNSELKGRDGRFREEVDSLGRPILVGRRVGVEAEDGRHLTTTIDRAVQYIAEKKLAEGMKRYGAKAGSVLIMEPATGKILAAANLPGYDPVKWNQYDQGLYKNPVVGDLYEPGSTFKVVTMAAALNEGVVTPETRCECAGPIEVGGFTIKTWNNKYHPNTTMTEALQNSDNIALGFVGQRLGEEKFFEYEKKFGFGEMTGVDLQEEAAGLVREPENMGTIDLVTNSFGQGIGVTMMQIVSAVGAIANEGVLLKPYLVEKIEDENSQVEIKGEKVREVISKETALTMTEMMIKAVEAGEAKRIIPKGYRVAGKTGTASIPIEGHYDPSKTIASFVGFGPAEDPRFVMLVRYVEPAHPFQFGSETAAPTFFEITKELFNYWGIPPSQ